MTPAEHYRESELALEAAVRIMETEPVSWIEANSLVALAGVHARLANVDPDVLWPVRITDD